jgi:hypothetical protein
VGVLFHDEPFSVNKLAQEQESVFPPPRQQQQR